MSSSKLASLFVLISLLWASATFSTQAAGRSDRSSTSDAALLRQLSQATGDQVQIIRHAETGKARFLSARLNQPLWRSNSLAAATPEHVSRTFLSTYGQLFGLRGQDGELRLMQQERVGGRDFVRFQQVYQGVPVLAGEIVVQSSSQRAVISANGEVMPDLQIATQPRVTADLAAQKARTAIAKAAQLRASDLQVTTPQLWIFNPALLGGPGPRMSRLVWRMEITAPATSQPIRELVLVDAQIGTIALHFNQIAEARQRYVCDDHNVIDPDGNQDNDCSPANFVRSEGQAATGNADADLAYEYAGATYDYYLSNFGRDSLDGKGLPLISLVRYCPSAAQCPYVNANWDGQQMTYGDGFTTADDVVGHELTHGFTEFTSHLFYYYQSGAINESLSDVFGELIDQTDGLGNDTAGVRWQLGEDLPASVGVVRDMADPTQFNDPDRTGSALYSSSISDNGGVHSNSGVNNKAAFLMTDGGTFNGQTITGLGADKVGAIYYTLEVAFLTSGSDYQDLYEDLPGACDALAATGAYGINAADCAQVRKVVLATEMNTTPVKAPAPEAPVCAPGQTSQDIFFDNFENPASGTWASSAAQGENTWYYPASNNPFGVDFTYTTSGRQSLWGYDQGGTAFVQPTISADYSIAMTRDVTVPANAHLHFHHAFDFEADLAGVYDGGVVEYSTNSGGSWNDAMPLFSENGYVATIDSGSSNPLHGRAVFGGVSYGYYSSRLDLSALAGQHVRFRFRIGTDESVDSYGWFIDDLRVYTCGTTPPTISLPVSAATVGENGGSIVVQATLSGVTDQTVSVPFTIGGTATENVDYRLTSHSLIIPASSQSGQAVIELINDTLQEPDETVTLTLGAPTNATLGTSTQATVTIVDNDTIYLRYLPLFRK